MKRLVIAAIVCTFAGIGAAQPASCKAMAAEKKLAGAALNSFLKKCKSDTTKACETQAMSKKLAGAAKASVAKTCIKDATG
jgi:hypothetical protein